METHGDLGTISVVGSGFACNVGAIFRVESLLAESNIRVLFSTSSALSVTCVVPRDSCKQAVEVLHNAFFADTGV